jgi:predicted Fe-Mo cluster-binding NifX family protein
MEIAVTAQGASLDAQVDPRFGRAPYIIIVDSESMDWEVLDNSTNAGAFKGAGIQAATMIHQRGAEILLTGYCGPKAFQTLQAAGVKVVNDVSGTVSSVLETFKATSPAYSTAPNAEAHW